MSAECGDGGPAPIRLNPARRPAANSVAGYITSSPVSPAVASTKTVLPAGGVGALLGKVILMATFHWPGCSHGKRWQPSASPPTGWRYSCELLAILVQSPLKPFIKSGTDLSVLIQTWLAVRVAEEILTNIQ